MHVKLNPFLFSPSFSEYRSVIVWLLNVCELIGHLPLGSLHLHNSWCHTEPKIGGSSLFLLLNRRHAAFTTFIHMCCVWIKLYPKQHAGAFNTYERSICKEMSIKFSQQWSRRTAVNSSANCSFDGLLYRKAFPENDTLFDAVYFCQSYWVSSHFPIYCRLVSIHSNKYSFLKKKNKLVKYFFFKLNLLIYILYISSVTLICIYILKWHYIKYYMGCLVL